jgi:apolipoprotein D and lipocalin family protein
MNGLLRCALAIAAFAPLVVIGQEQKSADGAARLDYTRYEGRYHEIARMPTSRQRTCASDVVTTFLKRIDGDVSFVNQCIDGGGRPLLDIGRIDVSASDPASHGLRFRPDQIGWSPWYRGTYRLIELAGDYSYMVIGAADHSQLWILSRARHLSDEVYQNLVSQAAQRGYDVSRLVRSPQPGL